MPLRSPEMIVSVVDGCLQPSRRRVSYLLRQRHIGSYGVGLPATIESMNRRIRNDGSKKEFQTTVRLDTPQELVYFRHGGILHFVLRQLLSEEDG